jgi:SAM-dependent methyltransferase
MVINIASVPFTYPWIIRRMLGDAKIVLDIGCGDGSLMKSVNWDHKYSVDGTDIYADSLISAGKLGVYHQLYKTDITKLRIGKKYDAVLSSQVIEHLNKKDGLKLLDIIGKIARSKIIIGTTNGFFPFDPICGTDLNPYQKHRSGWEIFEMRKMGYTVSGQGLGFFYKPGGLSHRFSNKYVLFLISGLSLIISPVVYLCPGISTHILCLKIVR